MVLLLWNAALADETVDEATALSGFSVTWERRPHRIKVLGVDTAGAELDDLVDIQGGSWADGERAFDIPRAEVDLVALGGRTAHAGSVKLDVSGSGAVWARRRELGTASTTIEVPLDEDGDVAVWLTGFRFATDPAHPDGFTLHTLSVRLGEPVREDGIARVPLEVSFGGGSVPDRAQSLGRYGAEVEIGWVAIPCRPDEVVRETVEGSVRLGPLAATRQRDADRVVSDRTWGVSSSDVVAGLSGFALEIHDGLFDGRYARALLFRVLPGEDGHAEVTLGFDNAGPMSRAVRVALAAHVTALAVRPTDTVSYRTWVAEDPPAELFARRRDRVAARVGRSSAR